LTGERLLAGTAAAKASFVPPLPHGADGFFKDRLLAAGTGVGVPLHEALVAHWFSALNIEGGIQDLLIAVVAQEVLRVPRLAQGGDHTLGDGLLALVTHNALSHFGFSIGNC